MKGVSISVLSVSVAVVFDRPKIAQQMQTYGTIHQHEFALTLKICTSA